MSQWSDGYVTVNGIQIHYHRTGGEKPPVVLAHGITDNGLCWSRLARALEEDYDLILVDARGHGLSDKPEQGYSREDHAADLAGLIQALGLDRPAIIGHSMGAASAAVCAARYPDVVGCLVLEDPPWRMPDAPADQDPQERAAQWREEILKRQQLSKEEIIAQGRTQNPTWSEEEFDAWAEAKLQVSPNVLEFVGQDGLPWVETVKAIRCPTLLVIADPERGAIVTPELARQAAALNPAVEVAHILGAGHNIRREQFDSFLLAVRDFLAQHVGSQG
ncbi:MAG: 3-oxoadipate enol-lactonase [Litorilinea sp.]|nr:MAG: 3-oxoadipate enol-lactonase [Litorilinea sp.]